MKSLDDLSIRHAAMDLLARREHSRLELQQKLGKRFAGEPEAILQEIDRLTEEGLQSDERLAESFIRARVNKGQGPVKIRSELKSRGVADEVVNLAMEACEVDWFDQARSVALRKFSGLVITADDGAECLQVDDMKEKARVSRFLQQRGFAFDQISSLF